MSQATLIVSWDVFITVMVKITFCLEINIFDGQFYQIGSTATDRLILAGSCFCEDSCECHLHHLATTTAATATNLALANLNIYKKAAWEKWTVVTEQN